MNQRLRLTQPYGSYDIEYKHIKLFFLKIQDDLVALRANVSLKILIWLSFY
jgi:hypothetical protein